MHRARPSALALVLALALAAGALADVATARRYIDWAKDEVARDNNLERADENLGHAEKDLAGVAEAEKAPLLAEIKTVRGQVAALRRARAVVSFDRMLERHVTSITEDLTDDVSHQGHHPLRRVEDIEPLFVQAERLLLQDDLKAAFDAEHLTQWRGRIDALRGACMRMVMDHAVAECERWAKRIEDRNAGGEENVSEESVEGWFGIAEGERQKLPDADARKFPLGQRLEAARVARSRRLAGDAKETAVGAAREWWGHMQRQHEGDTNGWERENGYEYTQWWREHGRMNLDRTEAVWAMTVDAAEDERWKTACEKYADDGRVKAIRAEASTLAERAANKICAVADQMLMGAEKSTEPPKEVSERVEVVLGKLEKVSSATQDGPRVLERARALMRHLHDLEMGGGDSTTPTTPTTPAAPTTPAPGGPDATGTTPAGSPGGAPAAEGGLGVFKLLLGCGCCFLLVAGGGGAAFVAMKQAKAAKT